MRRPQKTCAICESGVRVVDYKDERTLSRFLTERGQDPAQPAVGHLRPAPAAAQHRDQARPAAGAAALHQGLHRLSDAERRRAARRSGRWGQVLALAGFLLLAPADVPVRPARRRCCWSPGPRRSGSGSGCWARCAWSGLWLHRPAGWARQFARAAAVLVSGSFLALTLWRPSNRLSHALAATGGAAVALAVWMYGLGLRWSALRAAVENELAAFQSGNARPSGSALAGVVRTCPPRCPRWRTRCPSSTPPCSPSRRSRGCGWPGPGTTGSPGGRSAPPPAPFTAFGFSDQLVWGWVVGLGAGAGARSRSRSA